MERPSDGPFAGDWVQTGEVIVRLFLEPGMQALSQYPPRRPSRSRTVLQTPGIHFACHVSHRNQSDGRPVSSPRFHSPRQHRAPTRTLDLRVLGGGTDVQGRSPV